MLSKKNIEKLFFYISAGNSLDDFHATNTEDSNKPLPVIKKVRVRNRYGQLKCEICEKVLYKKREFNKHLATHKINR